MASTCISSNFSYHDPTRVPITRACYENQYKWPESDARFLKPVVNNSGGRGEVVVVDSRSCRQLYLRSAYTFTRANEDDDNSSKDVKERAKKCFNMVRDRAAVVYKKSHGMTYNNSNSKVVLVRKVNHFSCASFLAMVRRMLTCTPKVQG